MLLFKLWWCYYVWFIDEITWSETSYLAVTTELFKLNTQNSIKINIKWKIDPGINIIIIQQTKFICVVSP